MSDSVDRVFSHALNTVNKIRTGTEKPPASIRLKLYGLYKQSMEGDVEGIMEKPTGSDEASRRAREKWDAWHAQSGLSRTEAKRRYITTLIDTMHKYASSSPESRELVSELEFVWDQVKSNVPSSSSSSPAQQHGPPLDMSRHGDPPPYQVRSRTGEGGILHSVVPEQVDFEPVEEDEEEFVDAPDSQVGVAQGADEAATRNIDAVLSTSPASRSPPPGERRKSSTKRRSYQNVPPPAPPPSADEKWKKSISSSIIKLTAELAAVREQLEARRLFQHTIRFRILRFVTKTVWSVVKHVAVDVVVLGLVLLWLRRKKDRRLEGAIRVLLGDAVAQVQKLGDRQLAGIGKIQLPILGGAGGGKKAG